MSDCDCRAEANNTAERRILWIALALNAAMAVIGATAGLWAHSTGLLADALDMSSDAAVYGIGLVAIHRSAWFKTQAAYVSGGLLLALGIAVLVEVGRRALVGSEPAYLPMVATAMVSLGVNLFVMRLLRPFQSGEVHLRATWIFTRADVIANLGVIASGGLVAWTGSRYPDLGIGAAIGLYVIKEAVEILREASVAADNTRTTPGAMS